MERGADLHMAQLIPLPLTVFCFSKIQTGFTFLVPAHPGSSGQRAVKRVYVVLTNKDVSLIMRGRLYSSCVRSSMLHGSETWPVLLPFNGLFSRTTWVSRYQKGKNNLDFTGARDSEWQWHQLGRMQVCTSLQTDNHTSTPPLCFLQAGCPSCRPTNSVKALKALRTLRNATDTLDAGG